MVVKVRKLLSRQSPQKLSAADGNKK